MGGGRTGSPAAAAAAHAAAWALAPALSTAPATRGQLLTRPRPAAESGLAVLEALVDGRAVDVALRPATGRSAWLTFGGVGSPAGALGAAELPRLTLTVAGLHDSACAASDLFPSGGGSCQYVVQGRSGQQRCCNRGISRAGTPEMCGCE